METIINLADGCTLRSGSDTYQCGDYVRLCDSSGDEIMYWDHEEWQRDPVLVMGAILRSAAGLRLRETDNA